MDISQGRIVDVLHRNSFRAGTRNILERETLERLFGGNLAHVGESPAIDPDIAEPEISPFGIARQPFHRIIRGIGIPGPDQIDSQEASFPDLKVLAGNVL